MKMKAFKVECQSCGTPIQKETEMGKEKDGSFSKVYCRKCYQFGVFTESNLTVEKVRENILKKMKDINFPKALAAKLADRVYTLKRWADTAASKK